MREKPGSLRRFLTFVKSNMLSFSSAVLIVSVLFISSPSIVYFRSDASDFPLPLSSYLAVFLMMSIATILVVALGCALVRRGGQNLLAFVMAFLATMIFIEVYILMPEFGAFRGASIDWKIPLIRFFLEILAVGLTFLVVRKWMRNPRVPSALFIILSCFISAPAMWGTLLEQKFAPPKLGADTVFGLGDKNLLLVLLDGFPSDVFEEILDKRRDLRNSLSGFTYYPDTVGVSVTTFIALPSIHSGRVYSLGNALQPFFREAISDGSFMSQLSDAGFSPLLVNPINKACPRNTGCLPGLMVLNDQDDVVTSGVARLMGLSLFRAAPLALKKQVYDDGRWLFTRLVSNPRLIDHNAEGVEILDAFAEKLSTRGTQSTVKFLHLFTPHLPVVFGPGCGHSAAPIPATKEAFIIQSECALRAFVGLINSLKAKGLYDKTAIILLSDHGQGYPNRKANGEGDWTKFSGAANPLLVIKPLKTNGDMKVSAEPRWIPEIPLIACRLTNACDVEKTVDTTKRVFNYYEWKNEYWRAEKMPITQYVISGAPWKAGSWKLVEGNKE